MANSKIFKGISILIIIFTGIWFYDYSTSKTECRKQVRHETYGDPFRWNSIGYESREEAVKGCMRGDKSAKQQQEAKEKPFTPEPVDWDAFQQNLNI